MFDVVVFSQLLHIDGHTISTKENRFEGEGSGEGYADIEYFGLDTKIGFVSAQWDDNDRNILDELTKIHIPPISRSDGVRTISALVIFNRMTALTYNHDWQV